MERAFIFSSGRLKRKDNTLLFEGKDGKRRYLPADTLRELLLFGEVELNLRLLNFLSQKGILLHTFNRYGFYTGSYLPRRVRVSGFLTVKQAEHYLNPDSRLFLAASFVDGAAYHIGRNLKKRGIEEPKLYELQSRIYSAATVPALMQVEGKIRELYYGHLNSLFKGLKLGRRERRPPSNPVNALISFGNSLMYSTVLTEIYQTHLDPSISFLHEPSTGRYSLSLDIAEIFKPLIVDPLILRLVNKRVLTEKDFDSGVNYALLSEAGRKKFLKHYSQSLETTVKHRSLNRKVSYRHLIRLECYKLVKHLIGELEYKPLKAWW
ncbi:type I-B CRISPR-associated endonuclease Cas1b [Thermovibrio ammonificans]